MPAPISSKIMYLLFKLPFLFVGFIVFMVAVPDSYTALNKSVLFSRRKPQIRILRNVSSPLLVVSCINIFTGLGGTSDYRHPFLLSIRNNCILQLWQRTTNNNQRTLPGFRISDFSVSRSRQHTMVQVDKSPGMLTQPQALLRIVHKWSYEARQHQPKDHVSSSARIFRQVQDRCE